MSSEDYLTRYFQQLGKVLSILVGLREQRKYSLAIEEIDQVLNAWFGLKDDEIDDCAPGKLKSFLYKDEEMDLEKEKSIAELLYQKALTYKAMKKYDSAVVVARKAMVLFKSIDLNSGEFSIDLQQKIVVLDQLVSEAISD